MVDDQLTLLTEEARQPDDVTPEAAAASLAEANALAARTDAERLKKDRAVARARALRRLIR
jgi:F0F1-type ATP synthase epsilon subunit